MKQILTSTILILALVSAATGINAQVTTNLYYSTSSSGNYSIPISPVFVCNQTIPLFYKVNWDCNCTGYPGVVGPAPYRFTANLYRNNVLVASQTTTASVPRINIYFNILSLPGNYQSEVVFEILTGMGNSWETVKNNGNNWWAEPTIDVIEKPCCPSDILISGNYTTALQESGTWIKSSGLTTIPSGANVKLDATPGSYVLLKDGFETQAGSVFVAQTYNGCSPGAPQKPAAGPEQANPLSILVKEDQEMLSLYPNPTGGILTVRHPEKINQLQVYNLIGQLILTLPTKGTAETRLDMTPYAKGIYFVKAIGMPAQRFIRN